MVPSFNGNDDPIRIGGPGEGFGVFVGFGDEAIDGGLEIDEGMEDTPLEAPFCELGEEAFDGVERPAECWREVENVPLVAIGPGPDLWMLMGGVALPDHSFKTKAVGRADCEEYFSAHAPDSQLRSMLGIPKRTLPLGGDH